MRRASAATTRRSAHAQVTLNEGPQMRGRGIAAAPAFRWSSIEPGPVRFCATSPPYIECNLVAASLSSCRSISR